MGREIGTILGGIGLLIFAYLVFSQASGFSQVASSLGSLLTDSVSTLQGRSTGTGGFNL